MSTETYLQCGWINPYHYEEPKDHDDAPAYFEKMQQHPNAGPEGLVDGK